MALRPKLEFYNFKLDHKEGEFRTFKDFAKDELTRKKTLSDADAMKLLFDYFIKSLSGSYSKDKTLKKQLTLVKGSKSNKYLAYKPTYSSENSIIYGVINGGPFDRDAIISDINDEEDNTALSRNKSILRYYYFLIYLPLDHNEGCFIIHSNSKEETITTVFRGYVSRILKGTNFNNASLVKFCPKSFQEEFKDNAVVQNIIFKTSMLESKHTDNVLKDFFTEYDIKIEAIPKNKDVAASHLSKLRNYLAKKIYGDNNQAIQLNSFNENNIVVRNTVNDSQRTFEWNAPDAEFVPVVYLNERIKKRNEDGTLDFGELGEFCSTIFFDEILPEIRPDLYVSKIK